jgi:hypothetical protein
VETVDFIEKSAFYSCEFLPHRPPGPDHTEEFYT